MKTFLTLSLFVFLTFSMEAQSLKSGLTNTVDAINTILHQNKMVRFTNQDYDTFCPTIINANLQGDVFCIESVSSYSTKSSGIMFNLLKVESFVIKADEIVGFGRDQETIVAIALGNEQETKELRKHLVALLYICTTYSKLDPKFKCE